MNSTQLEREAEQTRAQVLDTLEELRTSVSPGQLVDQLVSYVRSGSGGVMVNNLGRQIVDNPLPLTLMGASLAWLMVSAARPQARVGRSAMADRLTRGMSDAGRGTVHPGGNGGDGLAARTAGGVREAGRQMRATAASAAGTVADATTRAADAAADMAGAVSRRAAATYDTAGDAAARLGDSASSMGRGISSGTRSLVDFCREQPLVLAGVGLAVGAAIGALLPETEFENRLMGDASDEVKERTQEMAGRQFEKAKEVAGDAYEAPRDSAKAKADGPSETSAGPKVGETEPRGGAGAPV